MFTDMVLIQAYLANVQMALQNLDVPHAETLLETVQNLLKPPSAPFSSPIHISMGLGLDPGIRRKAKPNEDFAFGATGLNAKTQDTYGLFVVADGMGGHANGRLASRLGVESLVNTMLPFLQHQQVQFSDLGCQLVNAVHQANHVVYIRNEAWTSRSGQMGTTITAAITFGPHAFIANVGDSRTYLYRPEDGLRAVTRDHSPVADLVKSGSLTPDEIYTHPQRNYIYRSLGGETVAVDLFYEQLQSGDILLLCSDGMWEMTRDNEIERILSAKLAPEKMAEHLVHLAIQGGGHDNIGLVISQFQMDLASMPTARSVSTAATVRQHARFPEIPSGSMSTYRNFT